MKLPFISTPVTARGVSTVLVVFVLALMSGPGLAQEPGNVIVHAPGSVTANTPLAISADLLHGETIQRVVFLYKPFGSSDFTRLEMDLLGNTASIIIPAIDVKPPFVEYYFALETRQGTFETHPISAVSDPFSIPPQRTLQVTVQPEDSPDQQVLFLSPERNSIVPAEELVISVSLFRTDTLVHRPFTRLLVDGIDVTEDALISDDIVVYVPANFGRRAAPGRHVITVHLFARDGSPHRSSSLTFFVAGPGVDVRSTTADIRYGASVQLESRHEDVSGSGTWYNRAGVQVSGTSGDWTLQSNLFVTSDETGSRQPQNRFFVGASSSWIKLGFGDSYPALSGLILNGKRVRGLHSSLSLGFFNIDMTLGKTTRATEGKLLKTIHVDSLAVEQERDRNAAFAPIDSVTWGKFSYGTFEQDLFAIRPSFGSGETWQLGFTWLKAKDDMQSIRYGARPRENLVIGSDFTSKFLNGAVVLSGEGAFSAFNSDISSGNFTDAYIDSVYPNDAGAIKRARNILDDFITVNDNLRPLSFKQLATLAYEGSIAVNAWENAFKFTYLYRGSEYTSFGQTFIRRDIRGFSMMDRLRLVDNQVMLTFGYERLKDNTAKTKPATTTYNTISTAVSYYPRFDFPNLTLGYSLLSNKNPLQHDLPAAVDERTHRFFVQSSYGIELGARHTATLGVSTSDRDDRSARESDVNTVSVAAGISTQYAIPLQTSVEYTLNRTAYISSAPRFDYSTLTLGGRYRVVRDVLAVRASVSPTFGDVTRTLAMGGVEWTLLRAMTFFLDYSYIHQQVAPHDAIWSLRYRYDL